MKVEIELSTVNIGDIFELATKHNDELLCDKCLQFVRNHLCQLIEHQELFNKLPVSLISSIMSFDVFSVKVTVLLNALIKWLLRNGHYEYKEIFEKFPWNLVSTTDYIKTVRPLRIISDDCYFSSIQKRKCVEICVTDAKAEEKIASAADGENDEKLVSELEAKEDIKAEEKFKLKRNKSCSEQLEAIATENAEKVKLYQSIDTQTDEKIGDIETKEASINTNVNYLDQQQQLVIDSNNRSLEVTALKLCKIPRLSKDVENYGNAINSLLSIVKQRITDNKCDEYLVDVWIAIHCIVGNCRENVKKFVSHDGVRCVLDCFRHFSDDKTIYRLTLKIITFLLESQCENIFIDLSEADVVDKIEKQFNETSSIAFKYFYAYILLLYTENKKIFEAKFSKLCRDRILEAVGEWFKNLDLNCDLKTEMRRFPRIVPLGVENKEYVFRLFSLYSIAYFTRKDSDTSCPHVTLSQLRKIEGSDQSMKLLSLRVVAETHICDWRKKRPPVDEPRKKKRKER